MRFFALMLLSSIVIADTFYDQARIGTGYKTKIFCTGVFVSHKSSRQLEDEELAGTPSELKLIPILIHKKSKKTTGHLLLVPPIIKESRYLEKRLGCQPYWGKETLFSKVTFNGPYATEVWRNPDPSSLDRVFLKEATDWAFAEMHDDKVIQTHAIIMVHRGQLVFEKYAPSFSAKQVLPGWSMTKSITNALIGRLVRDGKISVNVPIPVPEWNHDTDPRTAITWANLMQMASGLEFTETYTDSLSDVNRMLSDSFDMGAYAANKPLQYSPGTFWSYSSGSTNILTRALKTAFSTYQEYVDFPHSELFSKLGMKSAVFEIDASGSYVGSTSALATARDWAKFGQFILQDGVWENKRLLPDGWVKWSCTPTAVSLGKYGAGYWTNGKGNDGSSAYPDLPSDTCVARGYHGQNIIVIPSRELVLVRLGDDPVAGNWSINEFGKKFLRTLP